MNGPVERPWWYSGDEPEDSGPAGDAGGAREDTADEAAGGTLDWQGLLTGAARMVDWAASAVVEPHGEHRDPAEHPDCLVCRTLVLVQDRTGLTAPTPQSPVATEPPAPAEPVRWIPIDDAHTD